MLFYDIIEKKKRGRELTAEEIRFFVRGVTDGGAPAAVAAPDYQIAALLMAIRLKGMTAAETYELTAAMAESGETTELSGVDGICVDKHSTGGVSDATSLIVIPAVAAAGLKAAKLSGRGLGFTGGTLDKLEAFSGYNINQSKERFIEIVNTVGASLIGQTAVIAPADKKLYALRDVTATVDSIPLIASSVMSKKLAGGARVILLDVKYGSGAFMKDKKSARRLAAAMVDIGRRAGRKTDAVITSMEQPLGRFIGSSLECKGAIEVLDGARNELAKISLRLAARLFEMAFDMDAQEAEKLAQQQIKSGAAKKKLYEMVRAHGGTGAEVYDTSLFPRAEYILDVKAEKSGVLAAVDTEKLGMLNIALGGGRVRKEDGIDHAVGMEILKRLGDRISAGEVIARVHANDLSKGKEVAVEVAASLRSLQ